MLLFSGQQLRVRAPQCIRGFGLDQDLDVDVDDGPGVDTSPLLQGE